MENHIVQDYIKKVRDSGRPIHMHSKFCKKYKELKQSCHGCESQEGCNIVTTCVGLHATAAVNPAKMSLDEACSFADRVIQGDLLIKDATNIISSRSS